MNFFAHFAVATQFLTPKEPLPAYVLGTALPDLVPLAERRVRLRPAQLERTPLQSAFEAALSAGVSVHLMADSAFHKSAAFRETQAEVSGLLAEAVFDGIRVRRFFAAHVLTELALDAVLLRAEPALADEFYAAFIGADFGGVTRWAEEITGKPLPSLPMVLTRFAEFQYLRSYAEDDGVATGFSNVCRRAGQDTFEGDNFARLVHLVGQAVTLMPKHVPLLLSETAAVISF